MKVQVFMSDDVVARIDKIADYIGSSRSGLCAFIIAKALPEWEEIYEDDEKITQLVFE